MPLRHTRARDPISRSNGIMRGKFPSRKNARMIHWESLLERDAVFLFEFSSGVRQFREQPLTINYALEGKPRRYTPDFELILSDGSVELVEVKPKEKLLLPENSLRFTAITRHLSLQGWPLRFLTEESVRRPVLLDQLRQLFRYRQPVFSAPERRRWLFKLASHMPCTWGGLCALLGSTSLCWCLLEQQVICTDLRARITSDTVVTLGNEESGDEMLF